VQNRVGILRHLAVKRDRRVVHSQAGALSVTRKVSRVSASVGIHHHGLIPVARKAKVRCRKVLAVFLV
jgi:hypothetical protein